MKAVLRLARGGARWLGRHVLALAAVSWLYVGAIEARAWWVGHDTMYGLLSVLYVVGAALFIKQEVKSWVSKPNLYGNTTYQSLDHWSLHDQVHNQANQRGIQLRPRRALNRNQFQSAPTEPVVGFRAWRLSPYSRLELGSLVYGAWRPGVNQARCEAHFPANFKPGWEKRHRAPLLECHCGYWLKSSLLGSLDRALIGMTVVGVAQGWGHVVEHEDGWRVEYASVVAICALTSEASVVALARGLARRYDCLLVPELIDLAKYEAPGLGRR